MAAPADGVRIHAFHCGGDNAFAAVYDPFDPDPARRVPAPYFFYLVEHPKGRVLYDSGLHERWIADADLGELLGIELEPEHLLGAQLRLIGLAPRDVDVAVAGHLHFDHAGGLRHLRHADVLVHPEELAFATAPPFYQRDLYDARDFDHGLRWRFVDDDHDVFGDGRIRVLHTPGHTPGHLALAVQVDSGLCVLAGDATYLPSKMRERRLPAVVWNADATGRTWDWLEQLERDERAQLIFSHDPDFAERPVAPHGVIA